MMPVMDGCEAARHIRACGRADASNIPIMAKKACGGGILAGYKPLNQQDIEQILTMCL